jgi:hypothetical protein
MKWIFKIIGGMALFALAFFLFGYVTMYLWNWLMPTLFHLPYVDFYQAVGLVLLGKILFGGVRMRGGRHWGYRKYWKERMAEMSPEEREKFKTEFAERCRHKWGRVEVKVEKTE